MRFIEVSKLSLSGPLAFYILLKYFLLLQYSYNSVKSGIAGALYTVQTGIISPKAMDIAFSIEMVIWVAVGGRATLVGAVLGTLLVNFGKSLLSEQFPEIWLFFQGALFLIVVMVLPNGLVGWFRVEGMDQIRRIFRKPRSVITYPSLEEDPEVQREREQLENKSK